MKDIILDGNGKELRVGSKVKIPGLPEKDIPDEFGTITKITDPDADYDDDLERGVYYPPKVTVVFDSDDIEDTFGCVTPRYSWYPEDITEIEHICEDVELIENG